MVRKTALCYNHKQINQCEGDKMFTRKSKVKEALKVPGVLDIAQERAGMVFPSLGIKLAGNLTLEKLARQVGLPEEEIDALLEELNQLAGKKK